MQSLQLLSVKAATKSLKVVQMSRTRSEDISVNICTVKSIRGSQFWHINRSFPSGLQKSHTFCTHCYIPLLFSFFKSLLTAEPSHHFSTHTHARPWHLCGCQRRLRLCAALLAGATRRGDGALRLRLTLSPTLSLAPFGVRATESSVCLRCFLRCKG